MGNRVTFPPESDAFLQTVQQRVSQLFAQEGKQKGANAFFYFKASLLISLYIACYVCLLWAANPNIAIGAMFLMGPLAILIGINVAHDGAHGAISKSAWINNRFLSLLDFLGANSYMWKNRHVYSHHHYPNILNNDADLKQNPFVRIFPDDELKAYHKYQFVYAPFLYLLYTMNWLWYRDFTDFKVRQIGSFIPKKNNVNEVRKMVFYKAIYLVQIIVLPLLFSSLNPINLLVAYIFMNFGASIMISLALIPSHVAEHSHFPLPSKKGIMPHSWSHHQVLTVTDFATKNPFLNFFFGGFNHHVTHHLFPNICHVHYPRITPIVKKTALEFGLKYQHEESFINAYLSHFRLLKNNGKMNPKQVIQ